MSDDVAVEIARVGHVGIVSTDVDRAASFYSRILGLDVTHKTSQAAFLRCGSEHHSLAIYRGNNPGLHHVGLEVANDSSLLAADRRLAGGGLVAVDVRIDEPGQGPASRYRDPDGNLVELYAGMASGESSVPSDYRPTKFGHLTLAVSNLKRSVDFFIERLGFRLSDSMGEQIAWLRCDPDHHGLAFVKAKAGRVHHYAFEVTDWNQIKVLCDHFYRNGVRILYGPSRHGPGDNLFVYVADPDGNIVELFCELQKIGDETSYRPLVWKDEPKTVDVWRGLPPPDGFMEGDGRAFNDWSWGSPIIGAGWQTAALDASAQISPPTVNSAELALSIGNIGSNRALPFNHANSLLYTHRTIPTGRGVAVSAEMRVSAHHAGQTNVTEGAHGGAGGVLLALIDDSTGLVLTFEAGGSTVAASTALFPVTIRDPKRVPVADLRVVGESVDTTDWHTYEIRYALGADPALLSPGPDRAEWYLDGRLVHSVEWVANMGQLPPPVVKPAKFRVGLGIFDKGPDQSKDRSPTGDKFARGLTARWRALDVRF